LEYFKELGFNVWPEELPDLGPPKLTLIPPPNQTPVNHELTTYPQVLGAGKTPPAPLQIPQIVRSLEGIEKTANLTALNDLINKCQTCPLGQPGKTLGQGPVNAPIMIVLDPLAPGQVLPAGDLADLLGRIAAKVFNRPLKELYVTPAVKCFPPANLEALPPEALAECFKILLQEATLVQPQLVLAMGDLSGRILSQTNRRMYFLRPKAFVLKIPEPRPLQVTFGLEQLVNDQDLKKEAWGDMLKALRRAKL
jgi:uracil-DNA glycosylase family 4